MVTKKEIDETIIKLKEEFNVYKNSYCNNINIQRIDVIRLASIFNFNIYESR